MDLDTIDLKRKCSDFDINGDLCDCSKSIFSADGLLQVLGPSHGYSHLDLATLKERERDGCPLCRAILGRFKDSRLYRRPFREESVNVVLRIWTQPKCNGLSQGSAGASPMHVLSISLHSLEFAKVVQDISYELDIFAYEGLRTLFIHSSRSQYSSSPLYICIPDRCPRLFGADDPNASWILSRPPELDVKSPKTTSKAKAMISECQTNHIDCESASHPRLPTRVIDVRESTSSMVYLHISEESGEFDRYVTLSYCWGGDQPVVALKHNLDNLRSGIAVAVLPQTLQDAVQNTRDLGYQYFGHGKYISQLDGDHFGSNVQLRSGGILNSPRIQTSFITLTVKSPNGETGQICISHPCQWAHFGWHLDPLSKRGWTFQEFLLAKRILFYGPYEVLFYCRNLGFTRLFPSYIKYRDDQQHSARALFQSQNKAESWSELVRQYTFRTLTFPEDRSRAIAGIVSALEEEWDDRCVFGAWAGRFLEQMTWFNVVGFSFHPSLQRSNRAPSWSWLSIDGHVAIRCRSELQPDCIVTADLFEVTKGARLTLNCRMIVEGNWPVLEPNLVDTYMDIEETDESGGKPQFYLYLGSESLLSPEEWYHAFALIIIEENTDIFRRIGLIDVHSRNADLVKDIEQRLQAKRHITLI